MHEQPKESDARQLRKATPLPAGLTLRGNQKIVFNWLSIRGRFTAATIATYAGLNQPAVKRALVALVDKGIIQVHQWNDENYDPLYSVTR